MMASILTPVIESVHRGLATRQHKAFTPESTMVVARNTAYRSGNYSLGPAPGRSVVGDGAKHSTQPIVQIIGLEWDPGTFVTTAEEGEYQQLLYVNEIGELRTIVADANHVASSTAVGASRLINIDSWVPSFGSHPFSLFNYAESNYLCSGSTPLRIYRDADGVRVDRGWMPRLSTEFEKVLNPGNDPTWEFQFYIKVQPNNPVGGQAQAGTYHGWITLYDPETGLEGEAAVIDIAKVEMVGNGAVAILINKQVVDQLIRDDPDQWLSYGWRAYCGYSSSIAGVGPPVKLWPDGWLVGDVKFIQNAPVDFYEGVNYYRIGLVDNPPDIVSNVPYRYVSVTLDGLIAKASEDGVPPRTTWGTTFHQSAIYIDADEPWKMWWSVPGKPGSVPGIYFIPFETERYDRLLAAVPLGRVLGVFSRNNVFRVNYLPNGSDANFRDGLVWDTVSVRGGLVNDRSVVEVSYGPGIPLLAYVSPTGIYGLDLADVQLELTRNIDWNALVKPVALQSCMLVDDPQNRRLQFYFNENGGTPDKMLLLHYAESQLEDGLPAITGPVDRPGFAHMAISVARTDQLMHPINTDENGHILYEELGWSDGSPTGGPTPLEVITRERWPAGLSQKVMVSFGLAHLHALVNGGTTHVQMLRGPGKNPSASKTMVNEVTDDELTIVTDTGSCQYFQMRVYSDADSYGGHEVQALGAMVHEAGDA